jgi:hypothetical protein
MSFKNFPGNSKVWLYGFKQKLNREQVDLVRAELQKFVNNWVWHGAPVVGNFELLEDRFILLAATDSISGCSIDSSVSVFKNLKHNYNLDALDHDLIFYRDKDEIKAVSRMNFQKLADEGTITPSTPVFNLLIETLDEYHSGKFETSFSKSWHSRVFRVAAETQVN